jgi:glucose/arabinose dehydrogenase
MTRPPISYSGSYLILAAAAALSFTANRAEAQVLQSTLVQSGLTEPLYVCSPPGDTHRLFVCEHAGKIKIIKDGVLLGTNFIDLDPIIAGGSGSDERGLLGLAFHPDYANNGKFYVDYSDLNSATVIRQYTVSANPDVADTASFVTIFGPYADPQSNHNGGCLQFGPDGKLYVGLGDGGNANDSTGHDPTTATPSRCRPTGEDAPFDVENPPTYVPAGNPFPSSAIPLAWAIGLRNPWRFSFDRQTGDIYIADVGQGAVEEIDFQPASSTGGENYGWRCMEGTSCTGFTGCTCNAANLKLPIQTYTHAQGCSITGGYMYRGSAIVGFQGNYIYADYCNGTIWSFAFDGTTVSNFVDRTAQLDPSGTLAINAPTSFGEDASGEIYICDFGGGEIYRIDGECPPRRTTAPSTANSSGVPSVMGFAGNGSMTNNNLTLTSFGNPGTVFRALLLRAGSVRSRRSTASAASEQHPPPVDDSDERLRRRRVPFDVHAPPA